jgi:hypothetical protein
MRVKGSAYPGFARNAVGVAWGELQGRVCASQLSGCLVLSSQAGWLQRNVMDMPC